MPIFKRKPQWIETFQLQARPAGGRSFVAVFFWLWGLGGLILNGASLGGLTGSIGVGTSAYLAATMLFWIGGMVLFGMGALLGDVDFSAVKRADPDEPGDVRITRESR